MQRKYALPVLIFVLLTIAVFVLFRGFWHSQAAWQFIPSDANAVITSDRIQDSAFVLNESNIDIKTFPLINQAAESLSLLGWIIKEKSIIERTLQKKNLTFSFHPRSSLSIGVIMYIPLKGEAELQWWTNPNQVNIRVLKHTFQNTTIVDINDVNSKPACSYIIRDNYLIVSRYGELIEDVIRQSDTNSDNYTLKEDFEQSNDSRYSLNIYIKNTIWKDLFFKSLTSQRTLVEFMKFLPESQDYHLSTDNTSQIDFESLGCEINKNYVTEWLEGQKGKIFKNHQYISQQTSLFFRIASRDSISFRNNFQNWHSDFKSEGWNKVGYYISDQREDFIKNVGAELILCQFEGNSSISEGKLALIEYSNYDKLRPLLAKLARLSTSESNVSLDKYQGYDLYSIPISEFPESLYGPLFSGFPRSYVSFVAPYLVISNSSQVLRNYISDFENRITWKQSPELDSVLLKNKVPAQLALVASPLKVGFASGASQTGSLFSSKIESIVLQCYLDRKRSYPSLSILPRKRRTSGVVLNRTFLAGEIEWKDGNNTLISIAQRQFDGAAHLLLTDQDFKLVRPSASYEKTFPITSLDGPIVAPPQKVDFLNIGRQQLILPTADYLYTIDEDNLGFVTTLKQSIPSGIPIKDLIRIEGSDDGSSRFIILDNSDNLFLWNKVNAVPYKINRSFNFKEIQTPLVSLNQLGSRSLIITQRNGIIYLVKEDGVVRPGFPVDLLTRIESPFTWSQNTLTGQPELVGVTQYGELVRVDLSGKIVERKQLYRPAASSRFNTLFDINSLDWLLVRTSDTKVAILNKDGNELFEIGNISPNSTIQYHYFGVDNRFISISSGGFTSLFDMTGKRLGDKPIRSDLPVSVAYQPSYYKIFIFGRSGDKYQTWTIKIR